MDKSDLAALEHDVAQETAACIARVSTLIERAKEAGARLDPTLYRDFAATVLDAAQDVAKAFRNATEAAQEEQDEADAPYISAQRRRDYMAYRG